MKYNIQQLETELERMDHIGGLESLHNPIEPIWIETFRRMDGLYKELCIARLNLLMAAKEQYPELVERDTDGKGDKMMQYAYINSSIIWYNNCFDLLLQVVWVFYRIWEDNTKSKVSTIPSNWTLAQIELMMKECKYDKIENWNGTNNKMNSIVSFHHLEESKRVRCWANKIKHRSPLHVKGVGSETPIRIVHFDNLEETKNDEGKKIIKINLSEDKYDSHKAFDIYDVSELISTLIEYHKGLCECIGACTSPILKQYNI